MKKFSFLVLVIALVFCVAGCDSNANQGDKNPASTSTPPVMEISVEPTSQEFEVILDGEKVSVIVVKAKGMTNEGINAHVSNNNGYFVTESSLQTIVEQDSVQKYLPDECYVLGPNKLDRLVTVTDSNQQIYHQLPVVELNHGTIIRLYEKFEYPGKWGDDIFFAYEK